MWRNDSASETGCYLLIVPEGIEMFANVSAKLFNPKLLIVPEGIEIYSAQCNFCSNQNF